MRKKKGIIQKDINDLAILYWTKCEKAQKILQIAVMLNM
jgi:hypothetical protein